MCSAHKASTEVNPVSDLPPYSIPIALCKINVTAYEIKSEVMYMYLPYGQCIANYLEILDAGL